jgi:superfamily II DNA helicase RecQ
VVIDECHLTYTASHYRARLAQLKNLRFLSCPIVLLTATQPPMLEHELAEAMLVRGAHYIRASTLRPNIRYLVHTVPASKMLITAVQICQRQRSCLSDLKGVVYCKSRPVRGDGTAS